MQKKYIVKRYLKNSTFVLYYDPSIKRNSKKLVAAMLSNKASENFKIKGSFKTSSNIPDLINKLTSGIESEINKETLYKYAYQRFGQKEELIPYLMCSQKEAIRQIAWDHTCKGNTMKHGSFLMEILLLFLLLRKNKAIETLNASITLFLKKIVSVLVQSHTRHLILY